MSKLLILNGPPSAGKDTLADILAAAYGYRKLEFKSALIDIACRIAQLSRADWDYLYKNKERPSPALYFHGQKQSPRRFLQIISEEIVKPVFGKRAFGNAVLQQTYGNDSDRIVFSDSGFIEELMALAACDRANHDITVIRLHREGTSYEGDTRRYLTKEELDRCCIKSYDLDNNGTTAELVAALQALPLQEGYFD